SRLRPSAQLRRVHAAPPLPGLFASAPATTINGIAASAQVQLPCKRGQDVRRVEMDLGDPSGRARVTRVVARDCTYGIGGLLDGVEREQPFAGRQHLAEPRVLGEHGTSAGEITDAAIAEPPASRLNVHTLRNHQLRSRAANVVAIPPR